MDNNILDVLAEDLENRRKIKKRDLYRVLEHGHRIINVPFDLRPGDLFYINGIDHKHQKFAWTILKENKVRHNSLMHLSYIRPYVELVARDLEYKTVRTLYGG